MEVRVVMKYDKTTPGTVRYREETDSGQKPVLGMLYVPNNTVKVLGNPESIIVTVTSNDTVESE